MHPTEIILDSFAGGGGASTGIELALGRSPDLAINHDAEAIAMHAANHPATEHHRASVWDVDPRVAVRGRPVGLAWFSPDCKHFSKAKGGKPREKRIRGLAWVVLHWVNAVRPRCIILENVEEFQTWGPLRADGHPHAHRRGWFFRCFVGALRRRGYTVEWRELRAHDYGAPTIRRRLFLVARCDGRPIAWPEPTHGAPTSEAVLAGRRAPWRTAAECIDWSLPCPSIFGRKRPLAEATLRRIAKGIMRYVVEAAEPFVVNTANSGTTGRGPNVWPTAEPLRTVTASPGFGLVAPVLTEHANATGQRTFSPAEPLRTQCAEVKGGHFALVAPALVVNTTGHPGTRCDQPTATICAEGTHHALVSAHLTKFRTGSTGADLRDPSPTITAGPKENPAGAPHALGLVSAFLAKHYTGVVGADVRQPAATVTATDHHSLVSACLVPRYGERPTQEPRAREVTTPAPTVVPTGNGGSLCTAHLAKLRGDNTGHAAAEPLHTVSAQGNHHALVRAFLIKYYGNEKEGHALGDPLGTVTTRDRFGLVTVDGEDYAIADIGLRMLAPRELFRAQGFPERYVIGDDGRAGLHLTKSAQVRMCGNSVCPPIACALVAANVPELARKEAAA